MRTQRGFTLAELTIVMVVMGVMAAVAVPRMFDSEQFSARGTRDFVSSSLRYAQKSAVAMRRNVCVSVAATQLGITYASTGGSNQPCAGNTLLNPGNNLPYNHPSNALPVKAPVSTLVNLVFDAQGRPLSSTLVPMNAAITISITGAPTPITVEPETGHVR
jgi:MSHA pilin protein MshC